jgi:hypothetical protein
VVVEVSGVGVAGAEEFMGNSESVVARACDAAEFNEGELGRSFRMLRGVAILIHRLHRLI